VVRRGARLAEPGEFTLRAFLNGRIDLVKAEAVADVIGAASERALRAAQARLTGRLGARIGALRAKAVALLAEIEGAIDFADEVGDAASASALAEECETLAEGCEALAASHELGRALAEGVEVILLGATNVGKSSLLNALVGAERAIVTPEPGTTRDCVEARIVCRGMVMTLVDTAGYREDPAEVEACGLAMAQDRARRADLRVAVRDASRPAIGGDENADIEVWNKVDLAPCPPGALGVCARDGRGVETLLAELAGRLGQQSAGDGEGDVVASTRQRDLLARAGLAARQALGILRSGEPSELAAGELRAASRRLGEITGEDVEPQVIEALFARFCVGK
jgi:tRNA modification GTPase